MPQVLLLHVAQGQGGGGLPRHQVHSDTRQHRPQHPGNDSDNDDDSDDDNDEDNIDPITQVRPHYTPTCP